MHYVYIVECADGTYYTGYTTEVERRIEEHNQQEGAKYTRGRTPVKLKYKEKLSDQSQALKRECAIKKLSREKKEELISSGAPD
ncbi:MAG: GIY-YIG nuclease family protein [Halanaerobiaceae bacterium]